ncbi:MAG: AAA family ATPase, partial [Desulfurellaceae bacterium]|nr:AAA family ATPase [Desulfurellaceae bacterium]
MIITQIRAENILRYAKLHLSELPSVGLIGISGPNESGKTSIVEIVCLALFGRTSTVEASQLTKIIKWGQFSGALWVDFRVRDGNTYTVSRQFDGDGTCTAQLAQTGSSIPLARGLEAVNEMIVQLGGFTYQRFVDSFYLAQRNVIAPEVLKQTVRVLSGIQTLNNISAECESEMRTAQDALIPIESKINAVQQQLADLNIQPAALVQLQAEHQSRLDALKQAEAERERTTSAANGLQTAVERVVGQVEQLAETAPAKSLDEWYDTARGLSAASQQLAEAYQAAGGDAAAGAGLNSWLSELENQLEAFEPVRQHLSARRESQSWLVGEGDRPAQANSDLQPLAQRRTALSDELSTARQRRLLMIGLGVLGLVATSGIPFVSQAVYALGTGTFAFVFLVLATLRAADVVCCRQELTRLDIQAEAIRGELQTLEQAEQLPVAEQVAVLQTVADERLSASVAGFVEGRGESLMTREG